MSGAGNGHERTPSAMPSASIPSASPRRKEPLQFRPQPRAGIMLVPAGGFGWVIGDHQVPEAATSECVVSVTAETNAASTI